MRTKVKFIWQILLQTTTTKVNQNMFRSSGRAGTPPILRIHFVNFTQKNA